MKRFLVLLGVACFAAFTFTALAAEGAGKKSKGKLRHVVAFKFKETAGKAQIDQVVEVFRDLKMKIPQITAFEWGTNVSPEKLDKGFTHQFILTFKSDKDRDAHLVHPDHKAFGSSLGPVLADVMVINFWVNN